MDLNNYFPFIKIENLFSYSIFEKLVILRLKIEEYKLRYYYIINQYIDIHRVKFKLRD